MGPLQELQHLLNRVVESEELVEQAEKFYSEKHHNWSAEVSGYFLDAIARKKDQIHYEWHRIHSMGARIARERALSIAEKFDL